MQVQIILEHCRNMDVPGRRILGIIARPDSLEPVSENEQK